MPQALDAAPTFDAVGSERIAGNLGKRDQHKKTVASNEAKAVPGKFRGIQVKTP